MVSKTKQTKYIEKNEKVVNKYVLIHKFKKKICYIPFLWIITNLPMLFSYILAFCHFLFSLCFVFMREYAFLFSFQHLTGLF